MFGYFHSEFKLSKIDFLVPIIMLSHGVGRIGCLLAGCCFGEILSDGHFLKYFHFEHYPIPFIESVFLITVGYVFLRKKIYNLHYYFIFYGTLRFSLEFFRGDILRGQWGIMTPSQWISIGLICMGIFYKILPKISKGP